MTNREKTLITLVAFLSATLIPWSLIIDSSEINFLKKRAVEAETNYIIVNSLKTPKPEIIKKIIFLSNATMEDDYIFVEGGNKALNLIKALEGYNYPIKSIEWDGNRAKISKF